MSKQGQYTTGEFAKKANVSIRTIHYYNEKGLIAPSAVSDAGYRFYSDADFARLQRILSLKQLGFSLEEIKEISVRETDSDFFRQSLSLQLELVGKKIEHLKLVEESLRETAEAFDKSKTVDWKAVTHLIQIVGMEKDLVDQFQNGKNIKTRINLHEKYSQNGQGWFPWIFTHLPSNKKCRILEIGCGDGSFWKICANQIPDCWDVTLSDVSHGMLEDASKNLERIPHPFVYRQADCQKLPFEEESFDYVLADFVLFYPRSQRQALAEIARVLCPGGSLICATYGQNHMKEIEQLSKTFNQAITLSRVKLYDNFGLENGRAMLEEFFSEIEEEIYPDSLEVTEAEPILDYILSCHGNQREHLLPRYDEFRTFLEEQIKKKGAIHITKQAGLFTAKK